jgi:uncharacterized protein (TIGR00255 family)
MIRSMTGYSKVQREEAEFSLSLSAKSTNHRFLDVQVRLPGPLELVEPLLRRQVKERIARGHVEVMVNLNRKGHGELQLNRRVLAAYTAACRELRDELGFVAESDPVSLLRIPGMLTDTNGEIPAREFERIRQVLELAAEEAFEQLNGMRAREGEALERDLRSRLDRLRTLSEAISDLARSIPGFYKGRLETRVQELLGSVELDRGRIAQEVAYLVSRSDIAEELTRFRSHLDQVEHLLKETSEVGKKLDFLLQEMNREANTLLSKTTDVPEVGLEITRQAIEMKTEIEKLREQAQNIE